MSDEIAVGPVVLEHAASPHVGSAQQWATRVSFFAAGLCMSAWAPLIPFVKARLQLDDAQLGALLLCLGAGSMVGMPIAGVAAGRLGCRRVIAFTALLACTMLPVLAFAGHVAVLAAALVVFGAAIGSLDVSMNIHAVIVERLSGRAMMSGFHGLYSVGGIAGAGSMSGMISIGLSPLAATLVLVASVVVMVVASYRSWLTEGSEGGSTGFVMPHGRVVLIGLFCFVLFLAEGSVLDWSAVLLTSLRGVSEAHAGIAYAAFSTAMTICRLTGDRIVATFGPAKVVLVGALCAATGFVIAAKVPSAGASILGFALVGMGASNVVPVMFSAAGNQKRMPTHLALAAVTTMGYAGLLTGPAMIGFIARAAGLAAGLLTVAAMLVGVALVSVPARLEEKQI